ncbi:MAG: hypothetical protein J6333_01790 [Planctomycetes bacterium]|nr:hypothetical protein [Planctomycetota bacterium]
MFALYVGCIVVFVALFAYSYLLDKALSAFREEIMKRLSVHAEAIAHLGTEVTALKKAKKPAAKKAAKPAKKEKKK